MADLHRRPNGRRKEGADRLFARRGARVEFTRYIKALLDFNEFEGLSTSSSMQAILRWHCGRDAHSTAAETAAPQCCAAMRLLFEHGYLPLILRAASLPPRRPDHRQHG
jgi:hypothetical protein